MNMISLAVVLAMGLANPAQKPIFTCQDGVAIFPEHSWSSSYSDCQVLSIAPEIAPRIPKGKFCYWRVNNEYIQWQPANQSWCSEDNSELVLDAIIDWRLPIERICKPKYLGEMPNLVAVDISEVPVGTNLTADSLERLPSRPFLMHNVDINYVNTPLPVEWSIVKQRDGSKVWYRSDIEMESVQTINGTLPLSVAGEKW